MGMHHDLRLIYSPNVLIYPQRAMWTGFVIAWLLSVLQHHFGSTNPRSVSPKQLPFDRAGLIAVND
jgi:hypothetical protein